MRGPFPSDLDEPPFVAVLHVLPDRVGAPDLVGVNGGVEILVNSGGGDFSLGPVYLNAGYWSWGFAAGDFNGDGLLDMAVSGFATWPIVTDGGAVAFLFGTADGGYGPIPLVVQTSGNCPAGLAALGPVGAAHAVAIADFCDGGITVSGDASRR